MGKALTKGNAGEVHVERQDYYYYAHVYRLFF